MVREWLSNMACAFWAWLQDAKEPVRAAPQPLLHIGAELDWSPKQTLGVKPEPLTREQRSALLTDTGELPILALAGPTVVDELGEWDPNAHDLMAATIYREIAGDHLASGRLSIPPDVEEWVMPRLMEWLADQSLVDSDV